MPQRSLGGAKGARECNHEKRGRIGGNSIPGSDARDCPYKKQVE